MTLFSNIQVVTVNKGWLYGLTKLKQLSLAHNQVGPCPQHLQENARHSFYLFLVSIKIKVSLNYIFRLTTLRTMAGTSAPHCGNSTFRETRFVTVFRIINLYTVRKFLAWHQSIFQ